MAPAPRWLLAGLALGQGLSGAAALRVESSEGISEDARNLLKYKAAVFQAAANMKHSSKHIDCSRDPLVCQAPLNCQNVSSEAALTKDGHPNYNTWCRTYPLYTRAAATCAQGNLSGYVKLILKDQEVMSRMMMVNVTNIDAEYCFLAGHCDNPHPANDGTTLEEMEQLCDKQYGSNHWRYEFGKNAPISIMGSIIKGMATGELYADIFHPGRVVVNQGFADKMGELSCAMGNFHCDVAYCKQTFCTDPYWSGLHSHLGVEAKLNRERKAKKAAKAAAGTQSP